MAFHYLDYIEKNAQLFLTGTKEFYNPNSVPPLVRPEGLPESPTVLIVAPHPDDECLMGGYALRMQQEWKAKVLMLPYSYGSLITRQADRRRELTNALNKLGFELVDPRKKELDKLDPEQVTRAIDLHDPDIVFSPHAGDGHATHTETFFAVETAIDRLKKPRLWIHTEFWQGMTEPNLLIPYTVKQVALLGEALMEHKGEIERNPYHLRFPAWLMDQVRRGSELIKAPGAGTGEGTGATTGSSAQKHVFGQVYFQKRVL